MNNLKNNYGRIFNIKNMQFKNTTEWIIIIPALVLMILGSVVAIIGYNNYNNGGAWSGVIVGGFFSLCGFLIIYFAENYLKNHKRCPQCAEVVKAEALKCKHCGSDF